MYIPKPALEDCLTSEISASGGDVMYDYITGSQIRRVHYFGWNTGSYDFEVHQGCTDSTQLFLVGAGGSGGYIPSQSFGSGAPYFEARPGNMLGGAGGGGAGGVLFINPNRELTGSLAIVPGKYPITIGAGGIGGVVTGSNPYSPMGTFLGTANNGEDTTFRYPFRLANDADIPSGSVSSSKYDYDSVYIKAGGGGFGAYMEWVLRPSDGCGQVGPHYEPGGVSAGDGGSGGGAAYAADGSICEYRAYSGSNIFPFRNQGNNGGIGIPPNLAYGGGGSLGEITSSVYYAGGAQSLLNIAGYEQAYSQGGAGQFSTGNSSSLQNPNIYFQSSSERGFVKGNGGYGAVNNLDITDYDLSFPPFNNGGWIDDLSYTNGTGGEAIITYALTGSQLTNGKLTYIDGGATGGIFSFIPCGEVRLETITVPAGKQACVCAMDTGRETYLPGNSKSGERGWR